MKEEIMTKLILAAFFSHADANEAVLELEEAGVTEEDFSVIAEREVDEDATKEAMTNIAMADGATLGGAVGGLAGLITGAVVAAGIIVGGPLAVLTGLGWVALTTVTAGALGAAAGGIVGALIGIGIPEETAQRQASVL